MTKQLEAPPVSISLTSEELQVVHDHLRDTLERRTTSLQDLISSLEAMLDRARQLQSSVPIISSFHREIFEKIFEANKETIEDYCLELPCYERNVSAVEGHLEIALDPEEVDDHFPENIADLKSELEETIIRHNDFVEQLINKKEESNAT